MQTRFGVPLPWYRSGRRLPASCVENDKELRGSRLRESIVRWVAILLLVSPGVLAQEVDPLAARDAATVEAALRLQGIDVNAPGRLRDTVLRHLERMAGTPRYVELIDKLQVRGLEDELVKLVASQPDSTAGVAAAELLFKREQTPRLQALLDGDDRMLAESWIRALGRVNHPAALPLLERVVSEPNRERALRTAAAASLGRSRNGQQWLLERVKMQMIPAELNFTVANALLASPDPAIREEAAKHISLPAAAQGTPLPPLAELIKQTGSAQQGQALFHGKATCGKCHQVGGQGREVGPNLSEIGNKLSKEAMFVSILDPSAGISHNYETFTAVLVSGNIVTGLRINQTDEVVTLRDAEAIDKTIPRAEIEELVVSKVSLMPADLQKVLSPQELVDVVAYLETLKKSASSQP
jgi:putative heme-binding domain-containing protein